MKTIYSIGHSNKTADELVAKLQEYGITDLIDVRTYPSSRYNPQFNKAELEKYIPAGGIKYHWRGRNLGGLKGNTLFNETIAKMLEASSDTRKLAVMCSEAKPCECHRTGTIEPEVIRQGGQMVHILWRDSDGGARIEKQQASIPSLFGRDEPEKKRVRTSHYDDEVM